MAVGTSPTWPRFHLSTIVMCDPPQGAPLILISLWVEPLTQPTIDPVSTLVVVQQEVEKFCFWGVCVPSQASGDKRVKRIFKK